MSTNPLGRGDRRGAAPHFGRRLLADAGDWLRRHQHGIRCLQWGIVVFYVVLLIVPATLPLPDAAAHVWNDITLFAQFVFWGVWWPGVLLSMLIFGRLWCGIMCPEGALSETASRHGLGRAVPGWIRWPGWSFVTFVLTTVYGQMVSVYQYPMPALLILGGSTAAAVAVGFLYGRGHRVWCRYLCPVGGVFGLLAKLSPVHYGVDRQRWEASPPNAGRVVRVACAPMVPLKTMESASPCHMCGRCAGFRNAIELRPRPPGEEVVDVSAQTATAWDSLLIISGLMGVAVGAFHWASSPWFVAVKQWLAAWMLGHDVAWPLEQTLPWWVLTNYPSRNDVLTVLDGAVLLGYVAATTLVMTAGVGLSLMLAAHRLGPGPALRRLHHMAQGLLPVAGCGVLLGLSAQTVNLLRAEGLALPWVNDARTAALAFAGAWSLHLIWRVAGRYRQGVERIWATGLATVSVVVGTVPWVLLFWIW